VEAIASRGGSIMTNSTQTLAQISQQIKALEKNNIQNVIKIGQLLHEASEQIKHGEYMAWIKTEFGWSHETSRRFRDIYALSQNPQIVDFDKLNISISALYLAAHLLLRDKPQPADQATGEAIIAAARQDRVTYKLANDILEKHREAVATEIWDNKHRELVDAAEAKWRDKIEIIGKYQESRSATLKKLECCSALEIDQLKLDPEAKRQLLKEIMKIENALDELLTAIMKERKEIHQKIVKPYWPEVLPTFIPKDYALRTREQLDTSRLLDAPIEAACSIAINKLLYWLRDITPGLNTMRLSGHRVCDRGHNSMNIDRRQTILGELWDRNEVTSSVVVTSEATLVTGKHDQLQEELA
jgi:hypothetical protein